MASDDAHSGDTEAEIIAARRARLAAMRAGGNAYPNDFRRDTLAADVHARFGDASVEQLEGDRFRCAIGGRMMTRRVMGKAAFANLQDASGTLQIYVRRDDLGAEAFSAFKDWDLGDVIGVTGYVFRTRAGELSVHAESIRLLTKALRPLPDKYHGLSDQEARYRRRYLDLMMNEESRHVFALRSRIVDELRRFLTIRGFVEVETPMMQVIPGGATARPFVTHHNALDMELYLRIAPELYLKRLVIGGIENVFEINRSFRNEGLSTRHNPEFTMLEFYQAYADYRDLMDVTETLMRELTGTLFGTSVIRYQDRDYDFGRPARRLPLLDAIVEFNPGVQRAAMESIDGARGLAERLSVPVDKDHGRGKVLLEIFEKTVEPRLLDPIFITAYPAETSPLARPNDSDPFVVDRFEYFVAGRELANGFSELNDPDVQAARFREQVEARASGDVEAMHFDADYIRALEYGLPPTAGEGIGVDRLVMLLTDRASIRDVILFPHMRPEG